MKPIMLVMAILLALSIGGDEKLGERVASKTVPEWIGLLEGGDPESRRTAAEVLEHLGPAASPAIPSLIRAISDPNPSVRAKVIGAIGAIGPTANEAVPSLVRSLSDPDGAVKSCAIRSLGEIGPTAGGAIPALSQAAADKDYGIWYDSIIALTRIGKDAVPSLIPLLETPIEHKRSTTLWLLGHMGPDAAKAVPALLGAYKANPDDRGYGINILETLARIGPTAGEAKSLLVATLRENLDDDRVLAETATWALSRMGTPPLDFLSDLLSHGNDRQKSTALDLLEAIGPPALAVAPMLKKLVEARGNGDLPVRAAAALSRIDPRDESFIPLLKEAIRDHEEIALPALMRFGPRAEVALPAITDALRRTLDEEQGGEFGSFAGEIIRALVWIAPDGRVIVPSLLHALRKGNRWVQILAADALGLVGRDSREAVTALADTLKSCADEDSKRGVDGDLGKCVAIAMSRMGEKAEPAVPMLIDVLVSPSLQKRRAAAIALGGIGPKASRATAALIRALNNDSLEVRLEAAIALGRVGPSARAAVPSLLAASSKIDMAIAKSDALREAAAEALMAIDPTRGRSIIERMINECAAPDFETKSILYNALKRKSPETDWYVRRRVRWLRGLMEESLNPAIFPMDRYRAAPPSGDSVEATINQLARFGNRASVAAPLLRELSRHPDPFWSRTAQEALREIIGVGLNGRTTGTQLGRTTGTQLEGAQRGRS